MNKQNQKSKLKNQYKWLAFINIPIQMGVIIFLFSFMGNWLDSNYPSKSVYYNKIFILVGVFIALYNVIRQVNSMGDSK